MHVDLPKFVQLYEKLFSIDLTGSVPDICISLNTVASPPRVISRIHLTPRFHSGSIKFNGAQSLTASVSSPKSPLASITAKLCSPNVPVTMIRSPG